MRRVDTSCALDPPPPCLVGRPIFRLPMRSVHIAQSSAIEIQTETMKHRALNHDRPRTTQGLPPPFRRPSRLLDRETAARGM